jgi:hypothetical protein
MFDWLRSSIKRWVGMDYRTPTRSVLQGEESDISILGPPLETDVSKVVPIRPNTTTQVQSVLEVLPVTTVKEAVINVPGRETNVTLPDNLSNRIVVPQYKIAYLVRTSTSSHGTFGELDCGDFHTLTLELPWYENRQTISCIPKGTYQCDWTYSPRFKRFMYQVSDVPNRSGIRIHSGNLGGDVLKGLKTHVNGCILMGTRIGILSGQKALLLSAPEVLRFENYMEHKSFRLIIDGIVG